ncbi:M20/M25/M40 family metallo-hydrolase [Microbacterium sp. SORGH_AS_0888]|uniref:M20/M25/M40 family metallo-hydrolase n=1 Tax=Microbacterium sp. SORGH_AS_0888 TaxID=3041791 RepID=UPI002785C2C5|nr:M20/M25/M40 family metallo-hydrolase [Microbacterium sp. SORGH_AS_0888]MDQ1128259.1 carboxypeptidase PM20D1 [Microbacterium sp. SORGH_AS_0888]
MPSPAPTALPGIAERLSRMIRIPTVSAEFATRGAAPFEEFIALLAELYPLAHAALELERHADLSLLYRWRGRADADPVVLMGHYDVVPADTADGWTYPAFEGRIADGLVHGRGALDDKGSVATVMGAVENLLAAGFTPARDVYLAFGADEEMRSLGADATSRALHERGVTPWLVLDEGGAVIDAPLPGVEGTAAMVGVGEKGVLTLVLTARGSGGHASAPPDMTAIRRIAQAVDRLDASTFRARTPAAVSRMIGSLAVRARGVARLAYRILSALPWLNARVFAAMGGEPAALVRTTVAATMVAGGTAGNVLPAHASATLNLRIALGETVESTIERVVRRIDDPEIDVTIVQGSDPSPESPVDGGPFALISQAVAASYPDASTVPYIMMQASDSRFYHRYSPAVYRFSPLFMNAAQRATIHGVDEAVSIDSLERGELFYRHLLQSLG